MVSEKAQSLLDMAVILAAFVALVCVILSVYTVPSGKVGIITHWGRAEYTVGAGMGWRVPIADGIQKMNIQTQLYQAPETTASHDLQAVTTTIAVTFHVDPQHVMDVFVLYGKDQYTGNVLVPMIQDTVKSVTAEYPIDQLINDREKARQEMQDKITTKATKFYLVIDSVNITDFKPSDQYAQAIEAKQVAQQQAEQAKAVVETKKQEAEQVRQTAQGAADAAVIAAKGAADAQVIQAQAQAQANNLITQSLTPELLQYQYITKLSPTVTTIYLPQGEQFILPAPK